MSDILRLKRNQIRAFVGDDPDAIRVIEQLIEIVNALVVQVEDLEARVAVLEEA